MDTPIINFIFLDVDGVLNCTNTINRVPGSKFIGVADEHLNILRDIIYTAGDLKIDNKIILSSSWRHEFNDNSDPLSIYLKNRLTEFQLEVYDITGSKPYGLARGEEIIEYLVNHEYNNYIILDDETFDYDECGISDRLVKTNFYKNDGGLQPYHVDQAIELLKKKPNVEITKEYYENISKTKHNFIYSEFTHNGLAL